MLFYVRCPGCARLLSKNLDKYHDDLNQILNNPDLNNKQREQACSELLDKYGYRQLCCRIRIMGLIPYHEIVVS